MTENITLTNLSKIDFEPIETSKIHDLISENELVQIAITYYDALKKYYNQHHDVKLDENEFPNLNEDNIQSVSNNSNETFDFLTKQQNIMQQDFIKEYRRLENENSELKQEIILHSTNNNENIEKINQLDELYKESQNKNNELFQEIKKLKENIAENDKSVADAIKIIKLAFHDICVDHSKVTNQDSQSLYKKYLKKRIEEINN